MTTITPTVGRVVWFYHETSRVPGGFNRANAGEPLAAIITSVLRDEHGEPTNCVHLAAFDAHGVQHAMPYVQLVQDSEKPLAAGRYATWMPYQIGQAKQQGNALAPIAEVEKFAAEVAREAIASTTDFNGESRRAHALQAALQTSNPLGREAADVLHAAQAYEAYLRGQ